jgi:uncharacterized membrane protein
MVHLFRGELGRANVWRTRLDTTTNWAVLSTGAMISFAFSEPVGHQGVILLNVLLVTLFLVIEARRYRYYDLWSSRVRLMETDFFAAMLVPPFTPSPDWAESLAENLLQPHFSISFLEAVGRRLRRNYLWIYGILLIAWLGYLWLHPTPVDTMAEILSRAEIGPLPGGLVLLSAVLFDVFLVALALYTRRYREASGEVMPRYAVEQGMDGNEKKWRDPGRLDAWYRHGRRRQQMLAIIITDKSKAVADRILNDMHRGVTAMAGTGMYTGASHGVLMCALTVTEVEQLKRSVRSEDPNAFVVVAPAQEIYGKGFSPLDSQP